MSDFLVYIYNSANKNMYKVQNEYRGRCVLIHCEGLRDDLTEDDVQESFQC